MSTPPVIPPDTPLQTRKRAVLVGASSGIGAALAARLAAEGYILALLARRQDLLQALCQEINRQAGEMRAFAYPHDVTNTDCIPELFQTLLNDLKRIDLLVYNAGVMPGVTFSEFNFAKDKEMVAVNLLGGLAWLAQAATLFDRMEAGQIVGISSVAADRGRVINPGYNVSKAGFDTYLEALRNRLTRKGVRVLTVRPGPVDTDLSRQVGGLFMVPAEQVAADIAWAIRKRKQVLYTPRRWRFIMFIVRNIPSVLFRRMKF